MVYDGNTLKFYIDGNLISSSQRDTGDILITNNPLQIGSIVNYDGGSECFKGNVDEINIF